MEIRNSFKKEILQKGIYLEQEAILIPWLSTPETLQSIATPKVCDEKRKPSGLLVRTPYKTFVWQDKFWCGFKCNISTILYNNEAPQSDSDSLIYTSLFRHCYINTVHKTKNAKEEYRCLESVFIKEFGKSNKSGYHKDLYYDYPWSIWKFANIELSLAMQERFVEFNTIFVKFL